MYGSPPPPVPRIAAPTAMSSSSASPTSRTADPPEIELADRLRADPRRVAGQICDRHVLHVDDADGVARRRRQRPPCRSPPPSPPRAPHPWSSPRARPPCRPRLRPGRSLRRSRSRPRSAPALTSSLAPGNESPSRIEPPPTTATGIGSALVFIRSTVSAIRSWIRARAGSSVEAGNAGRVADLGQPGRHREVGCRQDVAAEDERARGQLVADTLRPDLGSVTCEPPPIPSESTSGIRKFVRTPPISTATDASRGKPCWRIPTSEVVPPMSTTAQSVEPGEEGRAAHRVGRAGRERRDRVALCVVDGHQRAIVLAQVDGRLNPELGKTRHGRRRRSGPQAHGGRRS